METKIMVVAGEASGDLHAANLIRALKKFPDKQYVCKGMGGPELSEAGVEIVYDAAKVSVVGVFEVVSHLKDIIKAQIVLRKYLKTFQPQLLILIDLPDFNLILAKTAKKLGIPVFYYIAPQVWAWRTSRIKTIAERVDELGVILPFEESFLNARGLKARYVGHPLLDSVKTTLTKPQFKQLYGIESEQRCIGLLPGSRKREIASLLPTFLAAAEILQRQTTQNLTFLIPKAATVPSEEFHRAGITEYQKRLDIRIIENDRYNLMASCDCVVAASGTVTLELAILQIPMVVTYKLSPLSYRLGKLIIKLEHFSLVNLIAGYSAVPELLQHEVTPKNIAKELSYMLYAYSLKKQMKKDLALVKAQLGSPGASLKAAEMVVEMLADRKPAGL